MHIVNSVGNSLDKASAEIMLRNMLDRGVIDSRSARLMAAAMGDRAYADIPQNNRDTVRAAIFKNMLLTLIDQ